MDDLIHITWPVLVFLAVLLLFWAIRRYLFARNCRSCGFQLGRPTRQRKPLLGFMKLVQCRRCGAHSIRIA